MQSESTPVMAIMAPPLASMAGALMAFMLLPLTRDRINADLKDVSSVKKV